MCIRDRHIPKWYEAWKWEKDVFSVKEEPKEAYETQPEQVILDLGMMPPKREKKDDRKNGVVTKVEDLFEK